MSALQVASLFAVLEARDMLTSKLEGVSSKIQNIGGQMSQLGAAMTVLTGPMAAFGVAGARSALTFDNSMANIGAVLGQTQDELSELRDNLLGIGRTARAGPQAVVDSFYDIVGGVQDASTHMDILDAAIATAEAGQANLAGTTAGLISVMNAYDYSAEKAAFVSDVLTRTVGMGVGTMDQFTGALGPASGLAFDLGISFEELAASTAFLTSTGGSASESVTQLTGIMSAFLKPNSNMTASLQKMGFTSGTAAIKALGLQGAVRALSTAVGGSTDEMAKSLGTQEALGGAIGLLTERSEEFTDTFIEGIDGATAAARELQNASDAASVDIFMSRLAATGIQIGNILIPVLSDVLDTVGPIIDQIGVWIDQNPELAGQIAMVAAAVAALGPVLVIAGTAISAIGTVVAAAGAVIGAVASPVGLVVAGLVALGAAAWDHLLPVFEQIGQWIQGTVMPALAQLGDWFMTTALPAIVGFVTGTVVPAIGNFFNFLGSVWELIRPALESVYNWFVNEALPAIADFVTGTVLPAIQDFFNFIGGVWEQLQPVLSNIYNWFVTDALPAIRDFIVNTVQPAVEDFFGVIQGAWDLISPVLSDIYDWFVTTGLPAVSNFINNTVIPAINDFVRIVQGIWTAIEPAVTSLKNGILGVLQPVLDMINNVINGLNQLRGLQAQAQDIQVKTAGMSNEQVWQLTMQSANQQNLGMFTDLAARIAYAQLRADGGPVSAGEPYIIGERGPELFVPAMSGTVVPNHALGGGGLQIGSLVIHANSAAEGRAAADAFEARLQDLMLERAV